MSYPWVNTTDPLEVTIPKQSPFLSPLVDALTGVPTKDPAFILPILSILTLDALIGLLDILTTFLVAFGFFAVFFLTMDFFASIKISCIPMHLNFSNINNKHVLYSVFKKRCCRNVDEREVPE